MTELKQFKLPDVGEGLTEADIVKWHVRTGDKVTVNQTIVEIETAKAIVELPCPFEGVVAGLLVGEGETVDVGTPIISVDISGDASQTAAAGQHTERLPQAASATKRAGAGTPLEDLVPSPPAEGAVEPGLDSSPTPKQERQPVLVGYGVKLGTTTRRPRKAGAAVSGQALRRPAARPATGSAAPAADTAAPATNDTAPATDDAAPARPAGAGADDIAPARPASAGVAGGTARVAVLAKPPVRKLARELGVDLARVAGTGPSGSITRADIQAAAEGGATDAGPRLVTAAMPAGVTLAPTTGSAPREERIAIRGVRKHTAAAVVASAFTAPHITEFLQIDMTATMDAVQRVRALPEFANVRVSPLVFVAKAVLLAVARNPMINSSWDDATQEIVVRRYVNLGIAAATGRGLIVPNIKDAHALSLPGLARALSALAETARAGKTPLTDLQDGTITITNVGVFWVDSGTPILTPGEAAILAFGQVRDLPWVHDGELAVRKVCTLALSFDHRIVDGDLGSAVLRDVGAMLEDPLRMVAWA